MGFLDNLVKVFPGLRNRPLVIAGESYAGMYIVSTGQPSSSPSAYLVFLALHPQDLLRHEQSSSKGGQDHDRRPHYHLWCCLQPSPDSALHASLNPLRRTNIPFS
jgi:Serine carboxypeptidase